MNRPLSLTPVTGLPAGCEQILDAATVQAGFDSLAQQLQPVVSEQQCLLLAVMNGGMFPLMQLMQRLHGDYLIDYCHVSRYRDTTTGGELHWLRYPPPTVAGRTVLVVDDIYDAGETLLRVAEACQQAGAARALTLAAFVKHNPRRSAALQPDYSSGLTVPDRYVFGCGMDYAGHWRHLPAVYALPAEAGA